MDPAAPGLEAHFGLRRVLTTVLITFTAWLTANSFITAFYPKMTPGIQAAMFSHREIGVAFTVFIILYLPLHIIAARGLSLESLGVLISPLKNLLLMIVLYRALTFVWEINKYLAIPVLAGAFVAFELVRKKRAFRLRVADTLFLLLVIAFTQTSTRDGLIRLFVLTLGGYCSFAIAILFLNLFRKNRPDPSGMLLVVTVIFMTLFSAMMTGGTNSGKYNRFLPVMDNLHYVTSFLFVVFAIIHVYRVSRRYLSLRAPLKLVSLPLLLLVAAGLGAREFMNIRTYTGYATPIVNTAGVKPVKVSDYIQLKGYYLKGRDDWFERPSETCGTIRCHPELSEQHDLSAHGRAFDNDVFKMQLKIFIAEKGRAAADYCIACHAPLAVIKYPGDSPRAQKIDLFTTKDPAFQLGVSCIVCHRASPEKDMKKLGNASMAIKPLWMEQERYLGEELDTRQGFEIHRTLIHAANRLHKKIWRIPKKDWNYICASCHVVKLPASLSCDGSEKPVADQTISFLKSPYGKAGLTCAACHQQRFATHEISYNTVAHHYLGSGTSLPYTNKSDDKKFRAISLGFLRGHGDITLETPKNQLPPCLDTIDEYKKQYIMLPQRGTRNPFNSANAETTCRYMLETSLSVKKVSARAVKMLVETRNKCDGHTFPSGGGLKAYLEIIAYDAKGKIAGKYGGLDNTGRPLPTETTLGSRSHDKNGKPIKDRRFWRACGVLYNKRLAPGELMQNSVTLKFRPGAKPVRFIATWYYLRPEYFRNLEGGVHSPVSPVEIGRATAQMSWITGI